MRYQTILIFILIFLIFFGKIYIEQLKFKVVLFSENAFY